MKTSENIDEIAKAIGLAQAEMGGAMKDGTNPHFKSGFASLTSVIFSVKEPFYNNGLSFVQPTIRTDGYVGCVTRIMHTSGQWVEGELTLPLSKQDPQGAGSAITYARRYSLMSMVGLPTTDDDAESAMLTVRNITDDQAKEIKGLLEDNNLPTAKLLEALNAESVEQIKASQYEVALIKIQNRVDAIKKAKKK
jgi:hypothetical protein